MARNHKTIKHKQQLYLLVSIAVALIGVQIVNSIMQGQLSHRWGVWPRHVSGLSGILFAPWLHGSWKHLWSNLPVLLLFSLLAIWGSSTKCYIKVSIFIILGSGAFVWLFGRNSIHVGASGWLFGLWGWLILRALFQRNLKNIIISIGLLFIYGGLWLGLLPKEGISVEYHIAGVLFGGFAAWFGRNKKH